MPPAAAWRDCYTPCLDIAPDRGRSSQIVELGTGGALVQHQSRHAFLAQPDRGDLRSPQALQGADGFGHYSDGIGYRHTTPFHLVTGGAATEAPQGIMQEGLAPFLGRRE